MIDLNSVLIFIKTVECNNFTAAADQLHMTKSMVSRKITELEETLGMALWYRNTRRIQLTEAGKNYYQQCTDGINNILAASDMLQNDFKEPAGHLRIAAPTASGREMIGPVVIAFLKQYPKISIELVLLDRQVDLIAEAFDLAFVSGPLQSSDFIARKTAITYKVLCASKDYLHDFAPPTHPQDLLEHQCITSPTSDDLLEWHFSHNNKHESIKLKHPHLVSKSLDISLQAVLAGLGVSILPAGKCAEYIKSGHLVQLLPEWTLKPREHFFVFPNRDYMPKRLKLFIDFIQEQAKTNIPLRGPHIRLPESKNL